MLSLDRDDSEFLEMISFGFYNTFITSNNIQLYDVFLVIESSFFVPLQMLHSSFGFSQFLYSSWLSSSTDGTSTIDFMGLGVKTQACMSNEHPLGISKSPLVQRSHLFLLSFSIPASSIYFFYNIPELDNLYHCP